MKMFKPSANQYQVEIGHLKVIVHGQTPEEAVNNARRQLCEQLPRMWDVIANSHDDRFVVQPISQS